jgi:hypothetical protein
LATTNATFWCVFFRLLVEIAEETCLPTWKIAGEALSIRFLRNIDPSASTTD